MVTTLDDDSEAPTYESSLDAPVAREEPVGQNQAKTACLSQSGNQASASGPGCNSSTAASCDTVPATTAIDGHFGPHLESSICRICMCVVTRGTRTLSVDKAVQAFEELCQTSTENPALPTSSGDKGAHLTGISCLPEPTTSILFKCCFCTHVTGEQREILSHLTVHGDEQLKCQHFPKSFYRVEDLRHHSEIHKLEGTFECKRCPAAYQKYAHL
ncbi:B-cell lymphoma 6 protein homolog [Ixodes scapularis]|uniref:B-cell lymphoma 6 protein homolog n=1 Tax=Ixodes scapularis TaxID=6945 RepID=UPI001A9E651F|nr:B-cell lymphoma 6 protein homolog [Ixodes scapularis]